MHSTHNGEHKQRPCPDVASKTDEEKQETYHQHAFAVEAVHHESAERTDEQGCNHIARKHYADGVLLRPELFVKIYRQKRREYVKGEEKQEIARHHFQVTRIPKLLRFGECSFISHSILNFT